MSAGALAVLERDFVPPGPYRLPRAGPDGLLRRRDGALVRLLHHGEDAVLVRAWPTAAGVRVRAQGAGSVAVAHGVERMRFALGLAHDTAAFRRRFWRHPLLGPLVRARPWLRPGRRPEPFEALAWAVTEQLIEGERAIAIQRRLIRRFGRGAPPGPGALRDAPTPAALAGRSPAELQACDLSGGRSLALIHAAREVALGRVDLSEHEPAWSRLRRIRGIGSWTLECLALHGQGRDDQLPAGDLAYVKLVGRLEGLGRRATEHEVRDWFAPYAPHQALAGIHLLKGLRARGPAGARW